MLLLQDILQAPDAETLERFLSRIPNITNILVRTGRHSELLCRSTHRPRCHTTVPWRASSPGCEVHMPLCLHFLALCSTSSAGAHDDGYYARAASAVSASVCLVIAHHGAPSLNRDSQTLHLLLVHLRLPCPHALLPSP